MEEVDEEREGSHWPTCLLQRDTRREEKTIEELYDDAEEGLSNTELYTMGGITRSWTWGAVEERQYNCLNKKDSSAKDKVGRGEYSRRNDTMYTMYICEWVPNRESQSHQEQALWCFSGRMSPYQWVSKLISTPSDVQVWEILHILAIEDQVTV